MFLNEEMFWSLGQGTSGRLSPVYVGSFSPLNRLSLFTTKLFNINTIKSQKNSPVECGWHEIRLYLKFNTTETIGINSSLLPWYTSSPSHPYCSCSKTFSQDKIRCVLTTSYGLRSTHNPLVWISNSLSQLFSFINPGLFKFWQGHKFAYIHLIKIHTWTYLILNAHIVSGTPNEHFYENKNVF